MEDCAHAFHGWVQVLEKQTKAKQISPSAHESITSSHARAPICGAQASCPFIIPQLTRKYILIVKKDVYHLKDMGKKSCRHFNCLLPTNWSPRKTRLGPENRVGSRQRQYG